MDLDALLKRYFPVIPVVLLGMTAYFQASGVAQILGTVIGVGEAGFLGAKDTSKIPPPPVSEHNTTARAIIERNPFDSVKGNLDPPPTASAAGGGIPLPPTDDPYNAPLCDGAKLVATAVADDSAWSIAFLSGGAGEGTGSKRLRQTETYSGKTVWFIRADRVWLIGAGAFCQVEMFPTAPVKPASSSPSPSSSGGVPQPIGTSSGKASALVSELNSKIQRKSDTSFVIPRSSLDKILENQGELMKGIRAAPEKENGQVVGLKLEGVKSDSVMGALGMQSGDRLQTLNGFDLTNPEKMLEASAKLRTADKMTLSIRRNGQPMNLEFAIQ